MEKNILTVIKYFENEYKNIPDKFHHYCIWAGDLFTVYATGIFPPSIFDLDVHYEIQDINKLRDLLVERIDDSSYGPLLLSVLSKLGDKSILPFLKKELVKCYIKTNEVGGGLALILTSLHMFEEDVFEGKEKIPSVSIDENLKEAYSYLKKHSLIP